jgi:hypothetical protein
MKIYKEDKTMYLHCHSCDWSQDDFWSKHYNPMTKIWDDIKWLWKPRIISFDIHTINDLKKYTHVPVFTWGKSYQRCFSWNWLILQFVKEYKNAKSQKWRTLKSWNKYKDTAVCPKCKKKNFDID